MEENKLQQYLLVIVFTSSKDNLLIKPSSNNTINKRVYEGLIYSELTNPVDVANRVLSLIPHEVIPTIDKSARVELINVTPTINIDTLYNDNVLKKDEQQ